MRGGISLENTYLQTKEIVEACADKLCRRFHCKHLREDFISVGILAILTYADRYNPDSEATLSTFLYPHIIGAMKRELEHSLYPINLSKRDFEALCQQGNLSFLSLDKQYEDSDEPVTQLVDSRFNVEYFVVKKIYMEALRTEFDNLSFKEREILGGFFGVFGYKQSTLSVLGEQFDLTENAAAKAKDKAIKKLTDACLNGEIGLWLSARKAIKEAQNSMAIDKALSTGFGGQCFKF